jgi:hypothetical protein
VLSGVSGSSGGLVVAGWVEGEFADEFAVLFGDDPDLEFSDEHEHGGACPVASDADVVEPAAVAQGEFAVGVDAVFADPEMFVDPDALAGGDGSGSGVRGGVGGASADRAVRSMGVVVLAVGVELGLQVNDRGRCGLFGEPVLQGLV